MSGKVSFSGEFHAFCDGCAYLDLIHIERPAHMDDRRWVQILERNMTCKYYALCARVAEAIKAQVNLLE